MLSTNSLSAFSGVSSATLPARPSAVRQARALTEGAAPLQAMPPDKLPAASTAPSGFKPRGSLLNLSG